VKFTELSIECRRAMVKSLEFYVPGAKFLPAVRLGRWDGKMSYCSMGGSSYINLLDTLLPIVQHYGYEVEIEDHRTPGENFEFDLVTADSYSHILWPEGHQIAGQPIMIKEHQVEVINSYLQNITGINIAPTGAGKCLGKETLLSVHIDETSDFGKFMMNKLHQWESGHKKTY